MTADLSTSSPSKDVSSAGITNSRDVAILHWMQQLAPHGIFTTDTELRIQTWNNWLETHSGLSAPEVCGRSLFEVFPELVTRKLDQQFRRALEGQVSLLSTAFHGYLLPFAPTVRDSGFEQMQQTARIGPLLANRVVCGTITTIEDVTQREMQSAALAEHAAQLESKVRERTARLDESVAQLESFSYTVAHDLRAPIRTFKGYTEILLEDFAGEFPEKAREYLMRMKRAAEGMDLLTRDLLQFNKISRQQIGADRIDVNLLLNDIINHTPALQKPGVLTIQGPLHPVIGNRTMLQQCLANLLDNALKFVPRGQSPSVTLRNEVRNATDGSVPAPGSPLPFQGATTEARSMNTQENTAVESKDARNKTYVRIYVEDKGIGISPDHHRQIFGIFERIHGAAQFEGTGIGLAIVARAIQRMNGGCGVESALGQGSRFWIELPAVL